MGKAALRAGALLCALGACAVARAPVALAQPSQLPPPHSAAVVVLDASRAMGAGRLKAARAAVVRAIGALPPGTPVGVRSYGGSGKRAAACRASRGLLPVAPTRPAAVRSALKGVKLGGLAPLSFAATRAERDLPAGSDGAVVVVAGGPDSCSPPPACQTVTSGASAPTAPVDVIGLEVTAAARRSLECSARAAGGLYRDAAGPAALEPELAAALARATRDRRSLGAALAGGLEPQQASPAHPGEFVDTIAPDSERWYSIQVPPTKALSVAATLVAPATGDVSAPGSSLALDGRGSASFTGTSASNLFAFQPDRSMTVATQAPLGQGTYDVRVALRDSPDKALARKLGGRSLPLELEFDLSNAAARAHAAPRPRRRAAGSGVSWAAASAALAGCAIVAFAAVALAPRRRREEAG